MTTGVKAWHLRGREDTVLGRKCLERERQNNSKLDKKLGIVPPVKRVRFPSSSPEAVSETVGPETPIKIPVIHKGVLDPERVLQSY